MLFLLARSFLSALSVDKLTNFGYSYVVSCVGNDCIRMSFARFAVSILVQFCLLFFITVHVAAMDCIVIIGDFFLLQDNS